jgi:hypothetical protein
MGNTIKRVGLGTKMRSIFVVVAISLFWSASVKAGGSWIGVVTLPVGTRKTLH